MVHFLQDSIFILLARADINLQKNMIYVCFISGMTHWYVKDTNTT